MHKLNPRTAALLSAFGWAVGYLLAGKALAVLLLLALAALAAGWHYTGGDLAALPQKLQSLGAESLPHAGAKLV